VVTGIIDVGSNTLRLSLYRHDAEGNFKSLISKKIVAGLAGYVVDGALSAKGSEKLRKCLREFLEIVSGLEVDDVRVFATASLRSVSNAAELISQIAEETGFALEVLSGEEEARLSFLGAQRSTGISEGLVVDIGGASCELVRVKEGTALELCSLPVGCLSLSVAAAISLFFTQAAEEKARALIREQLLRAEHLFAQQTELISFVGGSARGVCRLARELWHPFERSLQPHEIRKIITGFRELDTDVLAAVRSAAPERAFTLAAGAMIMDEIIASAQAEELLISKYGVREGYLLDRIIHVAS
jgi:exopolyphosphatase/guanosine-5'-triphosphate,3'-diphosphate pyrophosphatase